MPDEDPNMTLALNRLKAVEIPKLLLREEVHDKGLDRRVWPLRLSKSVSQAQSKFEAKQ